MLVNALGASQMSFNVHALMQYADDVQGRFGLTEENEVLADRVFKIPLAHIDATARFDATGQGFDSVDQIVMIPIRLFKRPLFERVEPDIFQVSLRQG